MNILELYIIFPCIKFPMKESLLIQNLIFLTSAIQKRSVSIHERPQLHRAFYVRTSEKWASKLSHRYFNLDIYVFQ